MTSMMFASGAHAAGFALIEQNASGLGNAYAGQAAVAEDASTVFFNPAGLTKLEGRQVVGVLHYIAPSAIFSGEAYVNGVQSSVTGNGGDAGDPAFVPNFYYAMELGPDMRFGLGIGAPFGLATKYDTPWAGMTQAVYSHIKTININPSLAWKANEQLSLGVGLDWQLITANLTKAALPTAPYFEAKMSGEDKGSLGWNLGALWELDEATRVGLSYRSGIKHRLEGSLVKPLPLTSYTPVYAGLELPDMLSVSLFRRLNDRWELLADATRTGWSSFEKLEVRRQSDDGLEDFVEENWENVWRFSLGANYRQNERMTWRFGVAYDQTPVPDAVHRTPRMPDGDRTWLAVGGKYQVSKAGSVDVGYAHLFVRDVSIAHTEPSALGAVEINGTYDNQVDILSIQYTYKF